MIKEELAVYIVIVTKMLKRFQLVTELGASKWLAFLERFLIKD